MGEGFAAARPSAIAAFRLLPSWNSAAVGLGWHSTASAKGFQGTDRTMKPQPQHFLCILFSVLVLFILLLGFELSSSLKVVV
jgi:hypothetical protein